MTSAETYGPLAALNQLVNEYYAVEKLDPSKLPLIQQQIWELIQDANLNAELDLKNMLSRDHGDHKHDSEDELTPDGVPVTLSEMSGSEVAHLIEDIDGYLCELGMAQIRDGLHILGNMPPLPEMLRSMTRLANAGSPSLLDAIARNVRFDYRELLDEPGKKFDQAVRLIETVCYTNADVLEVLDRMALKVYAQLEEWVFVSTSWKSCNMQSSALLQRSHGGSYIRLSEASSKPRARGRRGRARPRCPGGPLYSGWACRCANARNGAHSSYWPELLRRRSKGASLRSFVARRTAACA